MTFLAFDLVPLVEVNGVTTGVALVEVNGVAAGVEVEVNGVAAGVEVEVTGVVAAGVEELFEIVGVDVVELAAGSDLVVRLERFLKRLSVGVLDGCTVG